jgi:predicted transcriptional regulator
VNRSPDLKPLMLTSSIRMDARLDQTTRQKVDELARHFHRPRAAVLCHIMRWGISWERTEPIDQGNAQGPVRHLHLSVPSGLHEHVKKAAAAAGVKGASWLRHMIRQISATDFPASWQEATPTERSHDSRTYTARFMLRLDEPTREKLEELSTHFNTPASTVIRHLIAQAQPEDFPKTWHKKTAERRSQQPRR